MKIKIVIFFLAVMLVITGSFSATNTIKFENKKNNLDSNKNLSDKKIIFLKNEKENLNPLYNSKQTKTQGCFSSKDQYCENGNNYYQIQTSSEHIAQGFKPQQNVLEQFNIFLKRSSGADYGNFSVIVRNNSVNGEDWLYGSGDINMISTSGSWLSCICVEPFEIIPGDTYYIIINILVNFGPNDYLGWRYGTGNPYTRGVAYYTQNDGENWVQKDNWDFNFQTWGTSSNPPNSPSNPNPTDGASDLDVNIDLSWDCSDPNGDPLTYDIYFGTSTPPTIKEVDYDGTTYNIKNLFYQTTYYWKIVAKDSSGLKTHGPVWHFNTKQKPPGAPIVNYVETYFADGSNASNGRGLLLQGLDLENTYEAFVSGSNIDEVEFDFSSMGLGKKSDYDGSDGWTATINTKNIINPFGTYKIKSHNSYGWSSYKTYDPKIVPIAGWLVNYIKTLSENESLDYVTFEVGIKDPKPKNNFWTLEASIDLSTDSPNGDGSPVDTDVDVPAEKVGGNYGYSGGIGSSVVICSDGTIDVSGGFSAQVEAKAFSGGIGASLHGLIIIEKQGQEYNIEWKEMYITINGEVTIPVFIIPLEICGIGVEAGIDITPSVEITFNLEQTDNPSLGLIPGLGIKLKDDAGIDGNVAFQVRAYAGLGLVVVDFYGEAGGKGTLYFKTPPTPPDGYFDNFVLDVWIGGRVRLAFWTLEGWYTYTWSYKDKKFLIEEYNEGEWSPLNRDYITSNYNEFVWDNSKSYGRVIENLFPHAKPCVASFPQSAGTEMMMVWAHDNANKEKVKGMELQYTKCTLNEQGEFIEIDQPSVITSTNDDRLQMDPQIVFDSNGNAVCVFIQTDNTINENSDYIDVAEAVEIAYCIWDKDSETWSNINTITTNNKIDTSPILASNDNGDVILVWVSDNDCDENNITINDRSIYASFWDGNSWSNPETLASNEPIVSTPKVALKDGTSFKKGDLQALCTFSMDGDNNIETTNDQNVYYIDIDQNTRDYTIHQFTTDSYQDISPSAVYGLDGNPYIVWLKNEFYTEKNTELYDGSLYYQSVTSRSSPQKITSGRISDPVTIQTSGSKNKDNIFLVGWANGSSYYTLNYAKITSRGVDKGVIYGCESKLSETNWCFAPGGITAATIERPNLRGDNKSCNLSFIFTDGYDEIAPITSCSLEGKLEGYGIDGPEFNKDVNIGFESLDEGGASLYKTEYRLDYGKWVEYKNNDITVSSIGAHKIQFRSIDKARNIESIKEKIFKIIISHAPNRPNKPTGSEQGLPGREYTYFTSTEDKDGDQIYYQWHWGDDISKWIGPYDSDEIAYAKHIWNEKGTYKVKVFAKDTNDLISPKSKELVVKIQKSKAIELNYFIKLYEKIVNKFPILKYILNSIYRRV